MVIIGTIVMLAAAVWLLVVLRLGGAVAGCLLVIFSGSVLGYYFFHVSLLTLDRLLWAVLCGVYVIQRLKGTVPSRPILGTDLIMLVFLALLGLSTLTSNWRVDDAQPMSRLLFLYVMPVGIFWITSQTKLSPATIRLVFASFAVFGVYLSLTAIAEVMNVRALVFPRFIMSTEIDEFLGRGRGPFLNPSANGIYIATCLASLWMAWPAVGRKWRPAIGILSVLMFVGALATLTRCVWLGVAVGTMLAMWLTFPKQKRLGLAMLSVTLIAAVVGAQWQNLTAFKRDENVSVSDMAKSASLRPMLAAVAWQVFSDHPLRGVGFGQYKQVDKHYIAQRSVELPLDQVRPYHQHNVFLSLLTEVGLMGTIPFIVLLVGWARSALRLWWDPTVPLIERQVGLVFLICLANYVTNGTFQDVALIPMVNLLLFFFAGLLSSVAKSYRVALEVRSPQYERTSHPLTA